MAIMSRTQRSSARIGLAVAAAALALSLWPSSAQADMLGSLTDPFRDALAHGSFGLALGLVFVAGLATALTPCVYPMIAITVSVFGARETKTRLEGAMLSGSFVLGIAALFTPLGVISALTGSAMGSALGNPIVVSVLALLFLAMAVSMFGAFDMNLPPGIANRLAQVGGRGYRGAFLVGFVSGVIAAPCTGPVITVLLTWVSTTRSVGFGALSLFVYSLGLGVLFFVVGTFAVALPKSGRWLDWIKSVFGIAMVALALYYLKRFWPAEPPALRNQTWIAGSAIALVVGVALGAVHLSFKHTGALERVRKGLGVALAVGGLLGAVTWIEALPVGAHITWSDDYEAARSEAHDRAMPLLVDFGAEWCNACKELEHEAFSDPRVVAEAQRFVAVRVDMTENDPETTRLLTQHYRQPGLPLVVIHGVDGAEAGRITGPIDADELLSRLRLAN